MRIIDFADGAQSETTPTIGNIVASALVQYPDDTTYEANEQGAPTTGNLYYNTTLNLIRYYTGTAWVSLVDETSTQTMTNKSIDADTNTITNIDNDEIKVGAAIDVTKLHDGSVDNTEFGHLDGVTSNIQTQLDAKQETSEKGQPNGYASLDGSGTVPAAQLPSYVDDVEEYADLASFPVTGETGKIYVAIDTNLTYRWTGSTYVEIGNPAATPQENVALIGRETLTYVGSPSGTVDTAAQQLIDSNDFAITGGLRSGFTFTPTFSGTLDSLGARIYGNGLANGDGVVRAQVFNTSAGVPTGSPIETSADFATSNYSANPSTVFSNSFAFTNTITLTAGTEYFMALESTDTGSVFSKTSNVDEAGTQNFQEQTTGGLDWTPSVNQNSIYHGVRLTTLGGSGTITVTEDIYVSVPPLPKEYHTIVPQAINLNDGECAYITINRAETGATNAVVTVDDITNVTPDDDTIIIARHENSKPYVGIHDPKDISEIAASSIATLTDVDLTGLADGDILLYNNGTGFWEPGSSSPTNIGDLGDVDGGTAPTVGDILQYNGTVWAPKSKELVRAVHTTGQAITASASTVVFDVETDDRNSNYDPSTGIFTADRNCNVRVYALITDVGPTLGTAQAIFISTLKNGGATKFKRLFGNGNNVPHAIEIEEYYELVPGDTITVEVFCSVNTNLSTAGNESLLFIHEV